MTGCVPDAVQRSRVCAALRAGYVKATQSAVTPLALIGTAHFSISLFTNRPR